MQSAALQPFNNTSNQTIKIKPSIDEMTELIIYFLLENKLPKLKMILNLDFHEANLTFKTPWYLILQLISALWLRTRIVKGLGLLTRQDEHDFTPSVPSKSFLLCVFLLQSAARTVSAARQTSRQASAAFVCGVKCQGPGCWAITASPIVPRATTAGTEPASVRPPLLQSIRSAPVRATVG